MKTKLGFARVQNTYNLEPGDGLTRNDVVLLRGLEHSGESVLVLCVAVEVDGTFEHDYHDVQLPGGQVVEALSGYHLLEVK